MFFLPNVEKLRGLHGICSVVDSGVFTNGPRCIRRKNRTLAELTPLKCGLKRACHSIPTHNHHIDGSQSCGYARTTFDVSVKRP